MPGQPLGNAGGAGVDHSLIDVHLIQNVPQLPAELLVDDVFYGVLRVGIQEGFQVFDAAGDGGEEGILIDDAAVQ